MNGNQQWLQLFENVSCFYRHMLMFPLWNKYSNYQNNIWDSLSIFLEGYAFERQGRRPDYFHAAVDSLIHCRLQNNLDVNCIWNTFKESLHNRKLNHRNNPLYPSSNPDNITGIGNKYSLIEALLNNNLSTRTLTSFIQDTVDLNRNIIQAFSFLKSIRGIGDKIASFYLRDLVVVININLVNIKNRELLQPIDIWVERTIKILAGNQNMSRRQVANWIVVNCIRHNLNPEHINMGIWFFCASIANSDYRLNQSLANINMAHSLVNDFRMRISNVIQNCQIA